MIHVVSIRVPSESYGRVSSDQLRSWVLAWFRQPSPLPTDPSPGRYKLSVRLTGTELAALRRVRGRSISSVVRSIAVQHIPAPQKSGPKWLEGILGIGFAVLSLISGPTKDVGQPRGRKS